MTRRATRRAKGGSAKFRGALGRGTRPRAGRHKAENGIGADPLASAREAGLHYVSSETGGIRRRRAGQGFVYVDAKGHRVRDSATLSRIRALVIPPAWTEVWICADPSGHLQATGRDAKGRKQYRYHARWRVVRDETKFHRMIPFGQALPSIRKRVHADLGRPGLSREKVLATVVELLDRTFIRVGNEEYARKNDSYGLTTLREEHAEVHGSLVHLHFRGKSGKEHTVELRDERVARIVRRCQAIPGHELFHYVDREGARHAIGSADVNEYLHAIAGDEFTAKDFRTWAGTVLAASALAQCAPCRSQTQAKKNVVSAIRAVAERLGNTPAVCRKCYVHPEIMSAYVERTLPINGRRERAKSRLLHEGETAVLGFLQGLAKRQRSRALQHRGGGANR